MTKYPCVFAIFSGILIGMAKGDKMEDVILGIVTMGLLVGRFVLYDRKACTDDWRKLLTRLLG